MRTIRPASQQEWIDEFIRAELKSARFRPDVLACVLAAGLSEADLWDAEHDKKRFDILMRYRGNYLAGLPPDATWSEVALDAADVDQLMYSRYSTWMELSEGTRRVADAVRNLDVTVARRREVRQLIDDIKAVASALQSGVSIGHLLIGTSPGGPHVLIEGHKRLTAVAYRRLSIPLTAFVGTSPTMDRWCLF